MAQNMRMSPTQRRVASGVAGVYPVPAQRLAVVDLFDELDQHPAVSRMMDRLGWSHLHVTDPGELAWTLRVNRPAVAVVILPADLPPDTGVIEQVRMVTAAPVAVIGALNAAQVVSFLAAGADTVLPVKMRDDEMGARLLALVRRAAAGSDSGARYLASAGGGLRVDLWRRLATLDSAPLDLTKNEFRLLVALMEAHGQTLPANRLINRVWGIPGGEEGLNTLRIGIGRLRRKLGEDSKSPKLVLSVRGVGYRFGGHVIEVASREGDRQDPGTADVLFAERLARRCEELASVKEPNGAASLVARSLVQEGTLDAVGLHLIEGDSLRLMTHHGFSTAWGAVAQELKLADRDYAAVQALSTDLPIQLSRPHLSAQYARTAKIMQDEAPGTFLFVPMRSGERVVGVLGCLRHSVEPFGPLTITYLQAVAALCGAWLTKDD